MSHTMLVQNIQHFANRRQNKVGINISHQVKGVFSVTEQIPGSRGYRDEVIIASYMSNKWD